MARKIDWNNSYKQYLKHIREAQQRGVTHKTVYTREQYRTVYNDFVEWNKKVVEKGEGKVERNLPRRLEQESREVSFNSIRALRATLKSAQQDILAKEAAGEKLTGIERVLRAQGRSIRELYSADAEMLWKQMHNMYSREEIAAILGSPEEEQAG